VLVINPPLAAILNLRKIEKRGLTIYESHDLESTLQIMQQVRVNLVIVFLRLSETDAFLILRSVIESFPEVKVIGVADQEVAEMMHMMEELEFAQVEAEPVTP
jgi:ActR/RegA family two-component response regulator